MELESLATRDLKQGSLDQVPLVEILGHAYARNKTGRLTLTRGPTRKEIYFIQGLPGYVTSSIPDENLLEVMVQFRKLSKDDAAQILTLQKEKRLSPEQALAGLGLFSDPEIYRFQIETFTQMVIHACGWHEGRYRFREGEQHVAGAPLFDLNPLELIYQGVEKYHSINLAHELQQAQDKKVRLRHGWEQALTLPEAYYAHSDVLDLFEQPISVGESIPRVHEDLGDLNKTLLFLYLLLVTGLLEFTDSGSRPAPEKRPPAGRKPAPPARPRPEKTVETTYVSTSRRREKVEPASRPKPGPTPQDLRQQAETQKQLNRISEAHSRFERLEKEILEKDDPFERLGISVETPLPEIQQAFFRMAEDLSLEPLPAEVQQELKPRQETLNELLSESFGLVSDPKKRMDYEQPRYEKARQRAFDLAGKQKLAQRHGQRGQWYLAVNRPDLARRCFQQALELDAKQPGYYAYVGWCCYRDQPGGNPQEARDYLEHALQLNPYFDQAHYFLGVMAKRGGEEELARFHFSQAVESNPGHAQAQRELNLIQSHQARPGLFGRIFAKPSSRK